MKVREEGPAALRGKPPDAEDGAGAGAPAMHRRRGAKPRGAGGRLLDKSTARDGDGDAAPEFLDAEARRILRGLLEREKKKAGAITRNRAGAGKKRKPEFRARASIFDVHRRTDGASATTSSSSDSLFRGFYALFWVVVTLLVVRLAAENWRRTGSPLGGNEFLGYIVSRDVGFLFLCDVVMCGLTGVSWVLQRLVLQGFTDWNRSGWIIQNIWQALFVAGVVTMTTFRDWPVTHTVFFILHGLVMLMKQHSYAFSSGYLSSVRKERASILAVLERLGDDAEGSPSAASFSSSSKGRTGDFERINAALASGEPLDAEKRRALGHLLRWAAEAQSVELAGSADESPEQREDTAASARHFYAYLALPTLVYEVSYPRTEGVDWRYVAEKAGAAAAVLAAMALICQDLMYPVIVDAAAWESARGWDAHRRLRELPWLVSDLMLPLTLQYILVWYLIWESLLNLLAELTCFADRSFYDAWWNSASWDQYARDWNRPVHKFLLRYVYHASMTGAGVGRETATVVTFLVSACMHELVAWCIFRKLRGYLFVLQMSQLPLIRLSRTPWLRGRTTSGNVSFWIGICVGPSLLASLYLVL